MSRLGRDVPDHGLWSTRCRIGASSSTPASAQKRSRDRTHHRRWRFTRSAVSNGLGQYHW